MVRRDQIGEEKREFRELAHTVAELGKSKICRAGEQVGDPGKLMLQPTSEAVWRQNSLLLKEISLL